MPTPTADKIQAIIAAVKAPATPASYQPEIGQGLSKALVEKIAAIASDK